MIYVLSSSSQIFGVKVRVQESRKGDGAASANLALSLKQFLSAEIFDEQQQYLNSAAIASYVSFNKIDQRNRFKASVQLEPQLGSGNYAFIEGSSSSGLGFSLALFDAWWHDLNKGEGLAIPVFATGEIGRNGEIKPISYYNEKTKAVIELAKSQQFSKFYLCLPKANEADLDDSIRQEAVNAGAIFCFQHRLQALLADLYGQVYDGDPLGRWEAFKGLQSFNYEDSLRFFGRDKDVQRLYNDLQSNDGILIVSGQSGSGKSSLIKAGLIPFLEKSVEALRWVSTTPKEINGSLLDHLLSYLIRTHEQTSTDTDALKASILDGSVTKEAIESLLAPHELFLLHIDQFEELYTTDNSQQKDIHLGVLQELTQKTQRIKIVLSIRNEYLPILLDSGAIKSPVISNVSGNLNYEAWQAIVLEQAAFSGYVFEQTDKSLAHAIIDDALNTPNSLPMVEFVLQQLAEQAKNTNQPTNLTHLAYERMGRLAGAIAQRANDAIDIDHADNKYIHHFFSLFVGVTNDGLAYAKRFAYHQNGEQLSQPLNEMIKKAIDASILISATNNTECVELKLAHDCLFSQWQAVKDWLLAQEEYLHWRNAIEHSFKQWLAEKPLNTHLLQNTALLNQGLRYLKLDMLAEPSLIQYLQESQRHKRKKRLYYGLTFLLIIFVVALYIYDHYRIKVEYHTAIAEKWSVPFGLYEIDEDMVKHRTGTYKLEYEGGKLRRLSYVNSYGTLITDANRDNYALWEYDYKENGLLDSIVVKSQTTQVIQKKVIEFNEQRTQAKVKLAQNFTKKDTIKYKPNKQDVSQIFSPTNSSIYETILSYNSFGFTIEESYRDYLGDEVLFDVQYAVIKTEYAPNGLAQKRSYLYSDGSQAKDSEGIEYVDFIYDAFNQIQILRNHYQGNGILTSTFDKDSYGNIISIRLQDDHDQIFGVNTLNLDENGLILNKHYTFPAGIDHLKEPVLAQKKFTYDTLGRLISLSAIDQFNNPIKVNISNDLPIFDNIEEDIALSELQVSYNSFNEMTSVSIKDMESLIKCEYDEKHREISRRFYALDGETIKYWLPNVPVRIDLDENSEFTLSIDEIKLKYDEHGNKTEGFFIDNQKQKHLSVLLNYDSRGNPIKNTLWYEGKPATSGIESHIESRKFDNYGNEIESYSYDEHGALVNILGYAINKRQINKNNQTIENAYFDKDNNPISALGMYFHKVKITYSDQGNFIAKKEYFDENNRKVLLPGAITDDPKNLVYVDPDIYTAKNIPIDDDQIYINSEPTGALIYRDDQLIGVTPFKRRPESENFNFKLVKAGYQNTTAMFNLTEDAPNIVLQKDETHILSNSAYVTAEKSLFNKASSADDIQQAISSLQSLVEQGHTTPLIDVFQYYQDHQQFDLAKQFLLMAVDKGDSIAQVELARKYYLGDANFNIDINLELAYQWAKKSADQNNGGGYFILALLLDENSDEALAYAKKACNLNMHLGCKVVGTTLLKNGDFWNGIKFHHLSHDLGNESSAFLISHEYLSSEFVQHIDVKKALQYAHAAWNRSHQIGYSDWLQFIYSSIGDHETAYHWYQKSVELDPNNSTTSGVFFMREGVANNFYQGLRNSHLIVIGGHNVDDMHYIPAILSKLK